MKDCLNETTLCHCGKPAVAKNLCRNHYNQQWKRDKGLIKGPKPTILCHCGEPQAGKGLCVKHYHEERRRNNPQWNAEYEKKYRATEKRSASRQRRRSALYSAEGSHTNDELLLLRENQKHCVSCGTKFSPETPSTVDHKTPLCRGGSNSIENLHLLCGPCNSSKRDKTWEEYLEWRTTKSSRNPSLAERGGENEVVEFPKRRGEG